jgi:hypothetical protein
LAAPVTLEGLAVSVRPVMGYARFPEDATDPAELGRRATIARRDAAARALDLSAYDPSPTGTRSNASAWSPTCAPRSRAAPASGSRSSRSSTCEPAPSAASKR